MRKAGLARVSRGWQGLAGVFLPLLTLARPCLPFLTPALAEELSAYAKAVAAYQERKLDQALRHAREAVREHPEHADAHFLLGELYYLKQELFQAQKSWETALTLAPSREDIQERLKKLKKEIPLERTLERSDTAPFVVRFEMDQMPIEVETFRGMLRETYRSVGRSFQYFPDHPITVILYPAEDFQQVKGIAHSVAGLYDGKIRLPLTPGLGRVPGTTTLPDIRFEEELKRILRHEYAHVLVHDLAQGRCPLWLNEGIAGLCEAQVRQPDLRPVREAFQDKALIPWERFWKEEYPQEQAQLPLYYGQATLVAQYLVKRWGWSELVELLRRLAQGYPMPDALKAQYRTEPAVIEKEWLSWLKRNL